MPPSVDDSYSIRMDTCARIARLIAARESDPIKLGQTFYIISATWMRVYVTGRTAAQAANGHDSAHNDSISRCHQTTTLCQDGARDELNAHCDVVIGDTKHCNGNGSDQEEIRDLVDNRRYLPAINQNLARHEQKSRIMKPLDNSDLLEGAMLRPGLTERIDYLIVDSDVWQLLVNAELATESAAIKREVVLLPDGRPFVEVYPMLLNIAICQHDGEIRY
jgi:hypothetical protein